MLNKNCFFGFVLYLCPYRTFASTRNHMIPGIVLYVVVSVVGAMVMLIEYRHRTYSIIIHVGEASKLTQAARALFSGGVVVCRLSWAG